MSKAAFPWLAVGRGGVRSRGGEALALPNALHTVRKLSGRRPCAHCLLGHPTSYLFSRSCWPSPPQPQTHTKAQYFPPTAENTQEEVYTLEHLKLLGSATQPW